MKNKKEKLDESYMLQIANEYNEIIKSLDLDNRREESKLLISRYKKMILYELSLSARADFILDYQYKKDLIKKLLIEFENKLNEITNRHNEEFYIYFSYDQDFYHNYLFQKLMIFDASQEINHIKLLRFTAEALNDYFQDCFINIIDDKWIT